MQHGYIEVYNLSGGYKTYTCIQQEEQGVADEWDLFPVIGDDGEVRQVYEQ